MPCVAFDYQTSLRYSLWRYATAAEKILGEMPPACDSLPKIKATSPHDQMPLGALWTVLSTTAT